MVCKWKHMNGYPMVSTYILWTLIFACISNNFSISNDPIDYAILT